MARPQARCRQFQQVPVRVAEIDADAAARPVRAAFDCDAEIVQACLPGRQFVGCDRERDMVRPAAVMGRDDTAGILMVWSE